MKQNKGFTLIELLVVIAIIGLMASVVLASLNSARAKAANSAVKANLVNARPEAALYFDLHNDYTGICEVTGNGPHTIGDNVSAAMLAGADISYDPGDYLRCNADSSGWIAFSKLKIAEGANAYFCVDSNGKGVLVDPLNVSNLYLLDGLTPTERCP